MRAILLFIVAVLSTGAAQALPSTRSFDFTAHDFKSIGTGRTHIGAIDGRLSFIADPDAAANAGALQELDLSINGAAFSTADFRTSGAELLVGNTCGATSCNLRSGQGMFLLRITDWASASPSLKFFGFTEAGTPGQWISQTGEVIPVKAEEDPTPPAHAVPADFPVAMTLVAGFAVLRRRHS